MTYSSIVQELISNGTNGHSNDNYEIAQTKDVVYDFIDFVKLDGERWALPYNYIHSVNYRTENDAQFITITYSGVKLTLEGYYLEDLYGDIYRRKVSIIRQTDMGKDDNTQETNSSTPSPQIWEIDVVEG